jgi:guanylate kinase
MIDRNEFIEWAHVYGNLYGTPRKELTEKMEQGIDVLRESRFVERDGRRGLQVESLEEIHRLLLRYILSHNLQHLQLFPIVRLLH